MKEILITESSYQNLKAELESLKTKVMPEIIKRLEESIKLGDLSENGEYQAAKDDQGLTAAKIRQIEEQLQDAKIIEHTIKDLVQIGSNIEIIDETGKSKIIEIVDQTQADPTSGKISNESPLGAAFMGKKKGQEVLVTLPSGQKKYKINDIK